MQEPHLTEVILLYARGENLSTGEYPFSPIWYKYFELLKKYLRTVNHDPHADPARAGWFEIGPFT